MDRVEDGGVAWRRRLIPQLNKFGMRPIDPTDKPKAVDTIEDAGERQVRKEWKLAGEYGKFSNYMKGICRDDFRFVEIADLLIVYVEPDYTIGVGTWDETFWSNRMKKPTLVFNDVSKAKIPDWLFGRLPEEMLFGPMDDMVAYLEKIDKSGRDERHRRWLSFGVLDLFPEIINES
jgi:hypothetical protein